MNGHLVMYDHFSVIIEVHVPKSLEDRLHCVWHHTCTSIVTEATFVHIFIVLHIIFFSNSRMFCIFAEN